MSNKWSPKKSVLAQDAAERLNLLGHFLAVIVRAETTPSHRQQRSSSPAWHRRARQQRARAREVLRVAKHCLEILHGSRPPMVLQSAGYQCCKGSRYSCGYEWNFRTRSCCYRCNAPLQTAAPKQSEERKPGGVWSHGRPRDSGEIGKMTRPTSAGSQRKWRSDCGS